MITLQEHLVGKVRGWMLMLLGAVALVLLIACANVANLMLARATVRGREMGIRAALGASRWRLVRGLLVEGLVLSLLGAAIGVLLAYLGVQAIRAWLPAGLPRVASIGIDLRVLFAAISAATLSGLFFGIVPALQSSRPDLTTALKDSGRSSTAGAGSQRLRSALVVAEVALAVMLLVGAGPLHRQLRPADAHRSWASTIATSSCFNVGPRHAARASSSEAIKTSRTYVPQMQEAVQPRARRARWSPRCRRSAAHRQLEPHERRDPRARRAEGRRRLTSTAASSRRSICRLLRIPLLARTLPRDHRHARASEPVVVINEAAAQKYWPGEEALGKRVKINGKERSVVGIVGDIRHLGPEQPPRQEGYIPFSQDSTHRRDARRCAPTAIRWRSARGQGRDLVGQPGAAADRRHGHARGLHGPADRAAPLQHGAARAVRRASAW